MHGTRERRTCLINSSYTRVYGSASGRFIPPANARALHTGCVAAVQHIFTAMRTPPRGAQLQHLPYKCAGPQQRNAYVKSLVQSRFACVLTWGRLLLCIPWGRQGTQERKHTFPFTAPQHTTKYYLPCLQQQQQQLAW